MYFISKSQWDRIPDDHKTERSQTHGGRACLERSLNPDAQGGPSLIFEGIHFEVIPDEILTGDEERDRLIMQLLEGLSGLKDEDREEWERQSSEALKDSPEALRVVRLAENVIADRLSLNKPR